MPSINFNTTDAVYFGGVSGSRVYSLGTLVFEISGVSITELPDGTINVSVLDDTFTITITSPAPYSTYDSGNGPGVYVLNSADFASGPVLLYPGLIAGDGTPAEGEEISLSHSPLVVYASATSPEPDFAWNWQSDVGGNSVFSNLGDTDTTYLLTASEAGDDVRLAWSIADVNGTLTGSTNELTVASGIASWDITAGDASATINSFPSVPITPAWDITAGDGSATINSFPGGV